MKVASNGLDDDEEAAVVGDDGGAAEGGANGSNWLAMVGCYAGCL